MRKCCALSLLACHFSILLLKQLLPISKKVFVQLEESKRRKGSRVIIHDDNDHEV
jgi:hypothetical protein